MEGPRGAGATTRQRMTSAFRAGRGRQASGGQAPGPTAASGGGGGRAVGNTIPNPTMWRAPGRSGARRDPGAWRPSAGTSWGAPCGGPAGPSHRMGRIPHSLGRLQTRGDREVAIPSGPGAFAWIIQKLGNGGSAHHFDGRFGPAGSAPPVRPRALAGPL